MKNFSFLAVLSFMLLNACNSNDEFEYLPSEKAELVAAEYLFFSKDGFTLQLTESEALNKGIKAADYISIKAKILLMNQGVMEKLEDLGENEPLDFFFPEERVLKDGLDKRIIISTNKDDGKDCISTTRDPRVLVVTTHNGSRGSGRTVMPRRTQRISYAAHTKCTFGLF